MIGTKVSGQLDAEQHPRACHEPEIEVSVDVGGNSDDVHRIIAQVAEAHDQSEAETQAYEQLRHAPVKVM